MAAGVNVGHYDLCDKVNTVIYKDMAGLELPKYGCMGALRKLHHLVLSATTTHGASVHIQQR